MEDKELEQTLVDETNDSTDVELTEDELLDSIKAEALKLQQPEESQVYETAEVIPETKTERLSGLNLFPWQAGQVEILM